MAFFDSFFRVFEYMLDSSEFQPHVAFLSHLASEEDSDITMLEWLPTLFQHIHNCLSAITKYITLLQKLSNHIPLSNESWHKLRIPKERLTIAAIGQLFKLCNLNDSSENESRHRLREETIPVLHRLSTNFLRKYASRCALDQGFPPERLVRM